MNNRDIFLDNLRAYTILLVVILHVSINYMEEAPDWWYYLSRDSSIIYTIFALLLDVFVMPTMFILAGYFMIPSLLKNGSKTFLNNKKWRLLFPWLIGIFLASPLISYTALVMRGEKTSLFNFLKNRITEFNLHQSQYWFLGVLMIFISVVFLCRKLLSKSINLDFTKIKVGKRFFVFFYLITTITFALLNIKFSQFYWVVSIIQFRPVHIINLFLYFLLGIFIERNSWFKENSYTPSLKTWLILFLISQTAFLMFKDHFPLGDYQKIELIIINSMLYNFYCLSCVMTLLALFKKYFNKKQKYIKKITPLSYGVYYVHFIFLPVVYYVDKADFPVYIRFIFSLLITLMLSLIFASALKRIPILKRMF